MGVRVDQPRDDGPALEIDATCSGADVAQDLFVAADSEELPVPDRHGAGLGLGRIQGGESTVHEDDIGEASGRSLGKRRRCNQRQEAAKDRATGAGHHRAGRHVS